MTILRILLLVAASLLTVSAAHAADYPDYNTSPIPGDKSGMERSAQEIAEAIKLGWNVGNTMEATGGETAWGNPEISADLLALVKESGFDAIRLPVAWNQFADAETAAIDPAWLDRVAEVVQMAIDEDLYVLVNIHWDGGWLERNVEPAVADDVDARQRAFWQQIATRLRDFDERLLFASANEPHVETAEQMAVLHRYHQTFVDAVRSTGGRNAWRVLVVQGPKTDIETTGTLWQGMPQDTVEDRLMAEVHYYTPWNFAGLTKDEDWGNQFYYWGAGNHSETDTKHNPTWGEEETVDALFDVVEAQFSSRGVPVILGEYSPVRRTNLKGDALALHNASRAAWLEYVTRSALENGMVPFYWDNGAFQMGSGIFDREALKVSDPQALDALLEGAGK